MAESVAPRPASTILLLRDSAALREVEVFMMVRHYEIDFNSGALVFPGGKLEKADGDERLIPFIGGIDVAKDELRAFRVAAPRLAIMFDKDLRLVLEPPKGTAMNDPIPVTLKTGADLARRLRPQTAAALCRQASFWRQHASFIFFRSQTNCTVHNATPIQ